MIYLAEFKGRMVGAIGIFYPISTRVEGEDEDKARLNLYDRYEHIMFLKLTPVDGDDEDRPTPLNNTDAGDDMPESMTDREYADACGTKCPFCKSENVKSDDVEVDGPTAWTEDECQDCGKNWTSQYELRGYVSHDDKTH